MLLKFNLQVKWEVNKYTLVTPLDFPAPQRGSQWQNQSGYWDISISSTRLMRYHSAILAPFDERGGELQTLAQVPLA